MIGRQRKKAVGKQHRGLGGYAAGGRNWHFNWTALCVKIYLIIWILDFDLHKIRLAPELPEYNYCISRGVSLFIFV
jgi:hypothetical protein